MPKLIVKDRQKTIQELDLTTEKVLIGRAENCTIKLEDPLVSREHCEIREAGGKYFLSDLESANGTYVGSRRISRDYELKENDIIKVGPYTIGFTLSEFEKPTRIIGVAEGGRTEKATEIFSFSGAPRVLIRSGSEVGKIYDLSNNPLVGRDPECDILLNESTVSRRHARFQFIDNKITVMDVGSRAGTRINGKLIDKPTMLKDGDKVQLGEVILEVDWKSAPRVEAERPTVPYFRPELVSEKKSELWKWIVGIAAAILIIVAIASILKIDRTPYEFLFRDAKALYEDGKQDSDMEKLDAALIKINKALRKQSTEEAQNLKNDIQNRIISINDSREFTKKANDALTKGDAEQAIEYVKVAIEKDPNNEDARRLLIKSHRTLAVSYELQGNTAKERGADYKSNDLYNKAISEWKEIISLDAADLEAQAAIERIKRKILPQPSFRRTPPPPTPYEKALIAYRDERLSSAKDIVSEILRNNPNDYKARELSGWIDLWEEAKYLLDVRKETYQAILKFRELLQKDPANSKVRDLIARLEIITSTWDKSKAQKLFRTAEVELRDWEETGDEDARMSARRKYQEIVNMGPPPSNATSIEHYIYETAKGYLAK